MIRQYKDSDYELICSWWHKQGDLAPARNMVPVDSTFVLEIEGCPVLSGSVFTTNTGMALLENFIGNPEFKKQRKAYSKQLVDYMADYAKQKGFDRIVAITYSPKLAKYYANDFKLKMAFENVTCLVREM
jgi:hypothetical protein